jgi:hypothetical protein
MFKIAAFIPWKKILDARQIFAPYGISQTFKRNKFIIASIIFVTPSKCRKLTILFTALFKDA